MNRADLIENHNKTLRWRWSPLFETEPIGGPPGQPMYINAALIVDGAMLSALRPSKEAAIKLLDRFLLLEKEFGRNRNSGEVPWGPRSLDLDLLAWGSLQVENEVLTLPHPRIIERSFVLVPLTAALTRQSNIPKKIPPDKDWPE